MPSPTASDDGATPTKTKTKAPTTPRRTPAVKRTPNGTTKRKVSATKAATPASAPARTTKPKSRPEPTLLGDFFLGRPTPGRKTSRRKSLDLVKAEMKVAAVSKLQSPGGVKDRVKQWQKASAAAATAADPVAPASEPDEVLDVDEDSVGEEDRRRIAGRRSKPDRRKNMEKQEEPPDLENSPSPVASPVVGKKVGDAAKSPKAAKPKVAPKKRVVSDTNWMASKAAKKRTPPKKVPIEVNLLTGHLRLPKDFVKDNSLNPPLEKKISDWVQRTPYEESPPKERRRTVSRDITAEEPSRERKSRTTSKEASEDDGIRIIPSRTASIVEDGIRVTPSREEKMESGARTKTAGKDVGDGIRITPSGSQKRQTHAESEVDETESRRYGSSRHLDPNDVSVERRSTSMADRSERTYEDEISTPSRRKSKPRQRKSQSPPESMAEIPVGYSAFSVLDMPVGADARAMRPPKPNRNPSFKVVPKLLKKVYTEGMNMVHDTVHDTVEPPRIGINQPPSIESWLNGTSDPFIDSHHVPNAEPDLAKQEPRRRNYQTDDPAENECTTESISRSENSGSRRRQRTRNEDLAAVEEDVSQSEDAAARMANGDENLSPQSPTGLRRSPAVRNSSAPIKSSKKTPLRERLADAFRGESTIKPKSSTIRPDPFELLDRGYVDPRKEEIRMEEPSRPSSRGGGQEDSTSTHTETTNPSVHVTGVADYEKLDPQPTRARTMPPRRSAPVNGRHRLSTIASVETFNSETSLTETSFVTETSSFTGTSSVLSQTTVTQNTSNSSYLSTGESIISRTHSNNGGLKRRLTKHSDLMSVLSLPDATGPGRSKSIRSARSIRTMRSRLETATIPDLLQELADDEAKYIRELNTLVDGVIPVLLTYVLSKSDTISATGLFNISGQDSDTSVTKPIVDMGIALERLKSLHKRIPLQDPDQLINWALNSHRVYEQYLAAWRMGFQDVVVNLAPASQSSSSDDQALLDGLPRNSNGDIVNGEGERVDVAFLLKRPLVRIKHLAKITKGVQLLMPSEKSTLLNDNFQSLLAKTRRRAKEEEARAEDLAAINTDATRARDPRTLAPIEDSKIGRNRQVNMKDFFSLQLKHSNGQRIDCRVEVILRDNPKAEADPGDVLICEVDALTSRWLLFPPVELPSISARPGDAKGDLVVMIRGTQGTMEWRELFTLTADDEHTAKDWIRALGTSPMPPPLKRDGLHATPSFPVLPGIVVDEIQTSSSGVAKASVTNDTEIPIGERRRRPGDSRNPASKVIQLSSLVTALPSYEHLQDHVTDDPKYRRAINPKHMMSGGLAADEPLKRPRAKRYHSRQASASPKTPTKDTFEGETSDHDRTPTQATSFGLDGQSDTKTSTNPSQGDRSPSLPSMELPHIPKLRKPVEQHTSIEKNSTPLKEAMRPEFSPPIKMPGTFPKDKHPVRADGAPPPPAHTSPSPSKLKKTPVLESYTPKTKNRRSSSPLKHEYQPSDASGTSSASETESDTDSYTDSSSDEELEQIEAPGLIIPLPGVAAPYGKKISSTSAVSVASLPNSTLVPSHSASQAPYRGVPVDPSAPSFKLFAEVSYWMPKGFWNSISPELCSIVVKPGMIEAFSLNPSRAASGKTVVSDSTDGSEERPLVALDLTPLVPLRQSNAVDIEVRSPPTSRSTIKCTGTVRFRMRTNADCVALYAAVHRARLDNPIYKRLEQERIVNAYGGQSYQAAIGGKRRNWFGRSNSYRASTRAPSLSSDNSTGTLNTALSALKRLGSGGGFNIAKSSIDTNASPLPHSSPQSLYSSTDSGSGLTPPDTPPGTPPGTAPSSDSMAPSQFAQFAVRGPKNLKVRLYKMETHSGWINMGSSRLSIEEPPRGMRQSSSLYYGPEKRVIVTTKIVESKDKDADKTGNTANGDQAGNRRVSSSNRRMSLQGLLAPKDDEEEEEKNVRYNTVLDVIIGGYCFKRYSRTGIAIDVWEDFSEVGPNGQEMGGVKAHGGVLGGRTRKWMFQFGSAKEAAWVFALVGGRMA